VTELLKHHYLFSLYLNFSSGSRIETMSDLFPKVTSDEIDLDAASEEAKREEELQSDRPPHHEG
jgi:hypothetical protein